MNHPGRTTLPSLPTCVGTHVKKLGLEVAVVPRPPGKEERAAVGPRQPPHVQQDLVAEALTAHMTSTVDGEGDRGGLQKRKKCSKLFFSDKLRGSIKGACSLMCIISAVSLVAKDVDVELVGDVQDQLH